MQLFGLPGRIIKNGRAAARWLRARADGLNAGQAARAVGVPRSTLYRWGKDAAPRNRRPHPVRPKTWTPALRQALQRLRQDFPMCGRAKIGPLLRAEGFEVSDAIECSPNSCSAASLLAGGACARSRPIARRSATETAGVEAPIRPTAIVDVRRHISYTMRLWPRGKKAPGLAR
jgi:hypothetical protein